MPDEILKVNGRFVKIKNKSSQRDSLTVLNYQGLLWQVGEGLTVESGARTDLSRSPGRYYSIVHVTN